MDINSHSTPSHTSHHTHRSAPLVEAPTLRAYVDRRSREMGLTRDTLAAAAGIGRSTLFDWLAGTSAPTPAGWCSLARGLRVGIDEMFTALGVQTLSPVAAGRLRHGWTTGELAKHAGVSYATAKAIEEGARVRPDAAARVADLLDLPAEFIGTASRIDTPAVTAIGKYLERTRVRNGWTITGIAKQLGVTRQLVSAWMSGQEQVAEHWYPRLAEMTGVDQDTLRQCRPAAATHTTA